MTERFLSADLRGGLLLGALALAACNHADASGAQGGAPSSANSTPASSGPAESPPPEPTAARYGVFGVKGDDVLNVRAEPDGKSQKVYSFSPAVAHIQMTGRRIDRDGTPWVEVKFDGGAGWVNRLYLTEAHPGGGCNDPNLTAAIRRFMAVASTSDGAGLKEIVSPLRGLLVRNTVANATVTFPWADVDGIFTSPVPRAWGTDGGVAITGSFQKVILPSLREVLVGKGAKEKCGELVMGSSTGPLGWPDELGRLTKVSFHLPPGGDGAWQTWVAGFEYVDGKPYVAMLVGYHRET